MRFAIRLISCAKLTRYRVRSRSSRVGRGGTKLPPIVREGPEASLLFTALPLGLGPQHAGGNPLLVHVQTTTARIDHFHRTTPFNRAGVGRFEKAKIS